MGPQKQARAFTRRVVVRWSSDHQARPLPPLKWASLFFNTASRRNTTIAAARRHPHVGAWYLSRRRCKGVARDSGEGSRTRSHYIGFCRKKRPTVITSVLGVPLNFSPKAFEAKAFSFKPLRHLDNHRTGRDFHSCIGINFTSQGLRQALPF